LPLLWHEAVLFPSKLGVREPMFRSKHCEGCTLDPNGPFAVLSMFEAPVPPASPAFIVQTNLDWKTLRRSSTQVSVSASKSCEQRLAEAKASPVVEIAYSVGPLVALASAINGRPSIRKAIAIRLPMNVQASNGMTPLDMLDALYPQLIANVKITPTTNKTPGGIVESFA